jgi:tetratricopeptide (TPR) repeat protein
MTTIIIAIVVLAVAVLGTMMMLKEKKINAAANVGRQMITEGRNLEGQKSYTDAFAKYSQAGKFADSLLALHKGNRSLTMLKKDADQAVQNLKARLLLEGDHYLQIGQLHEPPMENAYDCYQAVLVIEPDNQPAKDGLQKIGDQEQSSKDFWAEQEKLDKEAARQGNAAAPGISPKDRQVMESFLERYQVRINRILEHERYQTDVHGRLKIRLQVAKSGVVEDVKFATAGNGVFPQKVLDKIKAEIRTWKITGLSTGVEYETTVSFIQ